MVNDITGPPVFLLLMGKGGWGMQPICFGGVISLP